jgi:uncharacterized protein YraI
MVGGLAWSAAEAAPGVATGNVNMRTGPGTGYAVITTIPAGAPVEVLGCPSWCEVAYAGTRGWASSNYISAAAVAPAAPAVVYQPAPRYVYARPAIPARAYWHYGRPWWDDRYRAWRAGRHYWYGDRWYDRPRSGFYFGFSS